MRRWSAAFACALAVFVVVPASPVAAHASLVRSNPVDGSVLAKSPPVAEFEFTEAVLRDASSVSLLQLGSGQTQELRLTSSDGGRILVADLPALAKGAYILRVIAVDPADLHKTVASISFGIGVAAPQSVSGEQVDSSWPSIVLRVVTDAALLLTVGAVVIALLLVRAGQNELDPVSRLIIVGGGVVAVGWIGLFVADAAMVGFENVRWPSLLIESDPGRRALVGGQLVICTWWALRMLRRAGNDTDRWFVARILAVIATGFVVAAAFGGHAGIGGLFIVGVALRMIHLGSLSVWIGAVAAMWLLARRTPRVGALWPAVSKLAAVGLAATGASGLLLSGRAVVSVTALLSTTYGQRVVVKAGVLLVLAVLGAMAAQRVRLGGEPWRLSLELGLAGCAVVLAALLASASPARGEQFLPLPKVNPKVVTSDLLDLTVSESIEPGRPGPNLVQIRVLETRRPAPGQIEAVAMTVTGPDGTVTAQRDGLPLDGLLEWTDISIPSPGSYRVAVRITRPEVPVSPFVASWQIDNAPAPRAEAVLSTRRWAPIAATMAAAWLVIVLIGRWWTQRRGGGSADTDVGAELVRSI